MHLLIQFSLYSYQSSFQIRKWFREGNFRALNVKCVLIDRVQIGTKILLILRSALCAVLYCLKVKWCYCQVICVSNEKKGSRDVNCLEVGTKAPNSSLPSMRGVCT